MPLVLSAHDSENSLGVEVDIILSGAVPEQGVKNVARNRPKTVTDLLRAANAVSFRIEESVGVEIDMVLAEPFQSKA